MACKFETFKILKQPCPGNVLTPGKSSKSMKTIGVLIGKFKDLTTFYRKGSMGGVGGMSSDYVSHVMVHYIVVTF